MLSLSEFAIPGRLQPMSLALPTEGITALLGPNGSGKSSLLLGLANLLPFSGEAHFAGQDLRRWSMAAAACQRTLLPQRGEAPLALACHQVIALGAAPLGGMSPALIRAAGELSERLEVTGLLGRSFGQLSGGEQQRVLLVKTLLQIWPATNPAARWLLLDEPLTGLDWHHQLQLLALLDELAAEGLTIWLSLHDVNLAVRHAERVLCLQGGRLLAQGGVATVDEDLIQALYGVKTERLLHGGRPLFVSR